MARNKNKYKIDPRLLGRGDAPEPVAKRQETKPEQNPPEPPKAKPGEQIITVPIRPKSQAEPAKAPVEPVKTPAEPAKTPKALPKNRGRGQQIRPSEGKKQEQQQLFWARVFVAFSFCGTLLIIGLLSLLLQKPTVSEYEKRELATMPEFSAKELFFGSYLRDVELYYADTFPFREGFVKLAAKIDESRGIRIDGVRLIDAAPGTQQPGSQSGSFYYPLRALAAYVNEEPGEAQEERKPFVMEDDGAEGEQTSDGLFIYKNRAMSIFGGSKANGSWYAEVLSTFAGMAGSDVNVYSIVVPTSIEFYLPERYKSVTNSEKDAIDHIYSELDGVTGVDAYTPILYHADEYLYFNTDHHWTALGAYYAYTAYCEAAGLEPLSLDEYEARTLEGGFLGTFYNQSNDSELEKGIDTVEYYIVPGEFETYRYDVGAPDEPVRHSVWAEKVSGSNSYLVFLGSDFPMMQITTSNKNGRKAVLIKDSFGNAFAPFLLAHYEEVYIVDHRYFEKGLVSLVRENGINDVIFLKNVFAANTRMHIERTEGILY